MSTHTTTIEVIVTTCDRKCGRVVSEAPASKRPGKKKQPALVVKRPGKPDIVFPDLCPFCTNATDNLCDGIEKKEKPAKEATATGEESVSGDSHGTPLDGVDLSLVVDADDDDAAGGGAS